MVVADSAVWIELPATFCVERDDLLRHSDRDYDAFERLRGLRAWRH